MQQHRGAGARHSRAWTLLFAAVVLLSVTYAVALALPLSAQAEGYVNAYLFSGVFALTSLLLMRHVVKSMQFWMTWGAVALGLMALAVANVLYQFNTALLFGMRGTELADWLWLIALLPIVVGTAQLLRSWVPRLGATRLLDSILVGFGAFTAGALGISHLIAAAPVVASHVDVAINTMELLGDLIVVAIAIAAAYATRWRPPRTVWLLLVAGALFAVSDSAYVVLLAHGLYVQGTLIDLGWPLSALLYAVASVTPTTPVAALRDGGGRRLPLPVLCLGVAVTALLFPAEAALAWIARGAALGTVGLALVRIDMALRGAATTAEQVRGGSVDPMTGLPSARSLRLLPTSQLRGSVLVLLELEGLAELTATFGASFGDRVIHEVVRRLKQSAREHDVIARKGDDAFALLLRDVDLEAAVEFAELFVLAIEREMLIDGHLVRVSCCAGVSGQAGDDVPMVQLLSWAERALREAKRSGAGIVRTYTGLTGERSQERLHLRADIKETLRVSPSDFVAYYQPIVNIADGSVYAVESLVRWVRRGKVLAPDEFLSDLMQVGAVRELTKHMLETTLREMREADLACPVTLNISPTVVDDALVDLVRTAMRGEHIPADLVILEITEDVILRDPASAAETLAALRELGVRVLLDDFGTGWSGLSSLRDLVVDGIKVDGSFIQQLTIAPATEAIVRSVSDLADELGLVVVYEGVEALEPFLDQPQYQHRFVQGFAIARPMPMHELQVWLQGRSVTGATS